MGLFSFFSARTSRKSLTGSAGVLEALSSRQFSPYPALGGTNINTQRIGSAFVSVQNGAYGWIYLYQPSVRRVVDYIARNVAELGLKVYERVSDDEREHRGDHPAARALRNPNYHMSENYFIQEFVKAHLVFGNAYALKFPDDNGELTLEILPPARVGIVGSSAFTPDAYRIYRIDGTAFDVPPDRMIHWPATTGDDPRRGESYLETLREILAADAAAQAAVTELHRSGLALPGWLERPLDAPGLTPEAFQRLSESVANQAKDSKRHIPIFEEGMAFKQGGVTPEDAELFLGRQFAQELVASLFGMKNIPPVGEEERQQFYSDVLPPLTTMCASFFDLSILKEEYDADDHYFEFNPEKLQAEWVKTLTSASGRPVLTTNEARAKINLPPIDGGDELVTPANVIVGDNPRPTPMTMPIQDPNKPPQDGSHRTEDVPVPAGKAIEKVEWPLDLNGNGHVKEVPLVPRRARSYHRRNSWAGRYTQKFADLFARQRQVLSSKGVESADDERWNEELSAELLEISRRHFKAEGKNAAFRMASEFDSAEGQHWLEAKATGSAKGINETTAKHIEEQGMADAFAHAIEARAAAAGMAYATGVHSFSTKAAIQQDGGNRMVTIDGGECDICADLQGSYRMDEVPGWPPFHNACNCVVDIDSGSKSLAVSNGHSEHLETIQVLAKALVNGDRDEGITALAKAQMAFAKAITEQKAPQVTVQPAVTNINEGAVVSHTNVEAAKPAEVTFTKGALQVDAPVTVEPAEVTIQKGAVQNHVKVDAPPPAEVNVAPAEVNVAPAEVRFGKGAFNVEAPPPANVNIEEGAIKVEPAEVNVQAPEVNVQPPDVNVNVEAPKGGKRKVTFSDGTEATIEENDGRDQD